MHFFIVAWFMKETTTKSFRVLPMMAIVMFLAGPGHTMIAIYGAANMGFMARKSDTYHFNYEKYGGALGVEINFLPFIALGAELKYFRGWALDEKPKSLKQIDPASYGGFMHKGTNYIDAQFFELWLRPKLKLSTPIIAPYLVVPINLFGYGGMKNYGTFAGGGIGALVGLNAKLFSINLFLESGVEYRFRAQGTSPTKPPWPINDLTIPITLGLGYTI